MKRMIGYLALICLVLAFFAPCSFGEFDIYTFKKDRVDQELSGNRGYISGKPSNIPETKRNLKRTLIGVDVELAVGSDEEAPAAAEPRPEKVSSTMPRSKEPVTVVGNEDEEQWIK